MKTLLLFLLLAACTLRPARAQALTAEWAVATSTGTPLHHVTDAQGNLYVTGTFSGTITLGVTTLTAVQAIPGYNGAEDAFLAKLSPQGQYLWAMQLGDGQLGAITQLVADNAGNLYATGGFNSYRLQLGAGGPILYNSSNDIEGFVACFSAQTGQCQWARRFGGTGTDSGRTLTLNPAGELFVAGEVSGAAADFGPFTLPPASGYRRSFLAKLSPAGAWRWVQSLGETVYVGSLAHDGQQSLYLLGGFYSPGVTLGTTTLALPTPSGGSVASDALLVKYAESGAVRWVRQANPGGSSNKLGSGGVYDGQGHLYLAGSFASQTARLGPFTLTNAGPLVPDPVPAPPVHNTDRYYLDAYVARYDTAGTWQWATRWGGQGHDYARGLALDGAGQVVVNLSSYTDGMLAALNPGSGKWAAAYPLPVPVGLGADGLGRLYLAGTFTTPTLSLGGQRVANAGSNVSTGFVAKLGALPLPTRPATAARGSLQAWPTPGPGTGVWVLGAGAGQAVEVFDVVGRRLGGGTMPASGPLRLNWPGAGLAPGVYILRSGSLSTRWVVE